MDRIELHDDERLNVFATRLRSSNRVFNLAENPETKTTHLVKEVAIEPVLSAKVLGLANAALTNPYSASVNQLNVAVMMLGVGTIKSLAFSLAMEQLATADSGQPEALRRVLSRLWQEAVDAGAWAYILETEAGRKDPDQALMVTLMDRLPHLYVAHRLTDQGADFSEQTFETSVRSMAQVSRESVLRAFNLPETLLSPLLKKPTDPVWPVGGLDDILNAASALRDRPEEMEGPLAMIAQQRNDAWRGMRQALWN